MANRHRTQNTPEAPDADQAEGTILPMTKEELAAQAKELEIEGRSSMTKEELGRNIITETARRALAGEFGVGQERRRRLAEAGFDPNVVQREVTRLLNSK